MTDIKQIPIHKFHQSTQISLNFEIAYIPDSVGIKKIDFSQPQRPDFYEIMWIINANGTRSIDFKTYNIQPNTLFFLTPGQVHYWNLSPETTVDGYVIIFPEEFLQLSTLDSNFLRNIRHTF